MSHLKPLLEANQIQWGKYMLDIYIGQQGPQPLGTVVFEEIEEKAREKLKQWPGAFEYAYGSAGTSSTHHANLAALRSLRIVPRMLVPTNIRSLSTTLFGVRYPSPIIIAPLGVQSIFGPDGELAPARAAGKLGVPFACSTASSRSLEAVARANEQFAALNLEEPAKGAVWNLSLVADLQPSVPVPTEINSTGQALAPRFFQLYWPLHNEVTSSLLSRAKKAGYTVLVVTLDTMSLGWRPHDLERSYLPFGLGVGIEVGRTDPVFMKMHNRPAADPYDDKGGDGGKEGEFPYNPQEILARIQGKKGTEEQQAKAREDAYLGRAWLEEANTGLYRSWEDLDFILSEWEGPVVLKGIQSVADAERAVDLLKGRGREGGIVVSNHGGRQVDGALPSVVALERILKSQKVQTARQPGSDQPKFHVLFDSGIRTGSDILKAILLGADGVLIGRPYLYASILAGQAGVEQFIKQLLADLDVTMGLAGWDSLDGLRGKGLEDEDVLTRLRQ
ncbi:hypothetical protein D9758_013753 [Tetrapyrgos nigripes]|uniref:FMN hydroxy acid dehydrogenase domain-containing protein n=1 Tax=Tetrapyrgos nigripes TaxID=182062 RepID=A0A8H5G1M8_9AGAR|nr:hypothetical protein D9758_013753 [Tetrapyrgos nigripes]